MLRPGGDKVLRKAAVYASEEWEGVETIAPRYRAQVELGSLAFPDLYVALTAAEEGLRRRRARNASRAA